MSAVIIYFLFVQIADVKKNIETAQGKSVYPAEQQLLIHQGKILKDDTTLQDNQVLEDSFLVIMLTKVHVLYPKSSFWLLNFCHDGRVYNMESSYEARTHAQGCCVRVGYVQCSKYSRYNPDIAPILRLRYRVAMIWHIQTDIVFFIQNRR